MNRTLDPEQGNPLFRIRKVITYALWREIFGPCPTDTAKSIDDWRETAMSQYMHNHEFHATVSFVCARVLDIVTEGYTLKRKVLRRPHE